MHLTDADIVLLLRGGLGRKRFQSAKNHLADCTECTERLAFVDRLPDFLREETPPLKSSLFEKAEDLVRPKRSNGSWLSNILVRGRVVVAGLAAVVVVVGVLLLTQEERTSRFRADTESQVSLMLMPLDGARVESRSSFYWSSVADAYAYRVEIFHAKGLSLWNTTLTDTSVSLPATVVFEPGSSYLWRVEALMPDTRIYRSEIQKFTYVQGGPR
ncbi:MAG: hypothetical protein HYY49_05615 [Ignavibacteriales bacterium]|nr:hypothetical protein [Ignavibacteriales bacterium]